MPSEVDAALREQAVIALTWVKKDESVRIQSFMDAKYQSYRQSLPASDERPEPIIRAEWSRLYYYCHLRAWAAQNDSTDGDGFVPAVLPELLQPASAREHATELLAQLLPSHQSAFKDFVRQELAGFLATVPSTGEAALDDTVRDAWFTDRYYKLLAAFLQKQASLEFVPLLSGDALPMDQREDFKRVCTLMFSQDTVSFHDSVETEWNRAWNLMPKDQLASQYESFKGKWLVLNYKRLLEQYLLERDGLHTEAPFVFVPLVSVEEMPDSVRMEATEVFARVRPNHVNVLEEVVTKNWVDFQATLPVALPDRVLTELKKSWLAPRYVSFVKSVVDAKETAFVFEPAVDPSELPEGSTRQEAERLIKQMTPSHADVLKAKIEDSRLQAFQHCDLGEMQEIIERHWLVEHYYEVMATVVNATSASGAGVSTLRAEQRSNMTSSSNMFNSPKKRGARAVESEAAAGAPLVTRSVAQCHTLDMGMSDANRMEVYLLYFREEPRWVEVRDKKTGGVEKVPVVECLFGDCTGAIQADLWRQSAEVNLPRFLDWSSASQDLLLVELNRFSVKSDYRRSLPPSRKLVLGDNSAAVRLDRPSAASFLASDIELEQQLILSDFSKLTGPLPFVATVSGYVVETYSITQSRQGVPMRLFKLQDSAGRSVNCCAHGRHSDNTAIESRASVILFFALASPGLGSNPPMFWLYDHGHMVLQRRDCIVPPATQAVVLGQEVSSALASATSGA